MLKTTFYTKLVLSLGVLFTVVLSGNSQTIEMSKDWLNQERKNQLKITITPSISLSDEYKTIISGKDIFSGYKLMDEVKKDKYSVDYLNKSIKMALDRMTIDPPGLSDNGAGVIVGGLNLSDPKAWFMAAKLKKRKRKMELITTCVYSID